MSLRCGDDLDDMFSLGKAFGQFVDLVAILEEEDPAEPPIDDTVVRPRP